MLDARLFINVNDNLENRLTHHPNTVWGDHCSWQEADFSGSDFTGINNVVECVFVRCNFSNTIWDQADLWQSTFEDCDLTGADFDNADFSEVDL